MDSLFYDLENVRRFLAILPEHHSQREVELTVGQFLSRTLQLLGMHTPAYVLLASMQTNRALLHCKLTEIAGPLGFNPAVIMPLTEEVIPTPLPVPLTLEALELADVVDDLLERWNEMRVLGIASQNPKGVEPFMAVLPRVREKLEAFQKATTPGG